MSIIVTKRDGREVDFDPTRIQAAISAAFKDSKEKHNRAILGRLTDCVIDALSRPGPEVAPGGELPDEETRVHVEQIQDTIENTLMTEGFLDTAKCFIKYRANRTRYRDLNNELNRSLREIIDANLKTSSLLRDNGNVNGALVASSMAKAGGESMKMYNALGVIKPEIIKAHKTGDIHIHDLDYYSLTVNCFFIPLDKMLSNGFDTGNGWVRPAKSIETACAIAAIALQTSQNAFFGGQAFADFDFYLAPYVNMTFQRHLKMMIRHAIVALDAMGGDMSVLSKIREKYDLRVEKTIAYKDWGHFIDDYNDELDGYKCGRDTLPMHHFNDIEQAFEIPYDGGVWTMPPKMIIEAELDTVRSTLQALESFVHNVNSLFSRSGNQLPFSSVNFGLDISRCGRLVSHALLHATMRGIGRGDTAIFPISICKMMAGYASPNPEDPNYDIWVKSCEVCASRFYPNFVNVDAPFNKVYVKYDTKHMSDDEFKPENVVTRRGKKMYRVAPGEYWEVETGSDGHDIKRLIPETAIATMGCRTRSIGNVNGPSQTVGKGNLWFTTINLPAIAIRSTKKANPVDAFWKELDSKLAMCRECMEERYKTIKLRTYANLYFPMKNGLYMGSDPEAPVSTTIENAIRNGSSAIGYIGIAEVCEALFKKTFGVDKEATDFGYSIVKHIREYTDKLTEETHMNWTTFATPAENVCGRFAQIDARRFKKDSKLNVDAQKLWGKGYYTNSHMMPFKVKTTLQHKIEVEAPFHELTNGGHMFYYKIDGDPAQNVEAVKRAIRAMYEAGLGYFTITFNQDTCRKCGFRGIIKNCCPKCHCTDILRIRRITGYLVGRSSQSIEESWGDGKLAELLDRENI